MLKAIISGVTGQDGSGHLTELLLKKDMKFMELLEGVVPFNG